MGTSERSSSPRKRSSSDLIGKAQYLLELAQDYLDLARVDGGQLVLEADPKVDVVNEVVLPAVDIVRSQIDRRSMHVELCLPDETAVVECDPGLLRIVVVNLLSNAVKYSNEGGEIRVSVVREPSRLAVSVWNEGQGFPPEDRARLFRRFSRLRSTAAQKKGTGVGLYSAWRIIQLHHGRIRARSEQGVWAESHSSSPSRWAARPGSSSLARVATSPARGEVQTTAVMMGSAQTEHRRTVRHRSFPRRVLIANCAIVAAAAVAAR